MSIDIINESSIKVDWKDIFLEKMFALTLKDSNIEEAFALKCENLPESIFRFRKIDSEENFEREIQSLKNREIWLSSPSDYNDPYDCHYYVDKVSCNRDSFTKILIGSNGVNFLKQYLSVLEIQELYNVIESNKISNNPKVMDMYNKLNKVLSDISNTGTQPMNVIKHIINEQFMICSFSEINTSILMWSHYASNHKGFCVEYHLNSIKTNFIPRLIFPVIYTDEIFNATEYYKYASLSMNNTDMPAFNNLHHIKSAMFKAKCWKYEKEWRFIYPFKNDLGKNNLQIGGMPKAIYFGTKTEQNHIDKIKAIYSQTNVAFYKMNMLKNKYELVTNKI
ncbi:MAG: DUF2971 domain-containing protein [Burkholderiales bacterium]|nr:DUF2971 domain-containing protein [Burkholderiales bacterium]